MPGIVHVLDPYHGPKRGFDDAATALELLEETIELEGPETIAAFILEPVTGTNGILIPPEGYLQGVRELCTRFGIQMIADEVMCGWGRTGEWFAVDNWKVVPDIITTAKGLTSGYSPLGAAIISDKIFEPFGQGNTVFPHGYTFGGHPVSCAVALANLDIFEREDLLGHVLRNENALRQTLERLYDLPIVGDIRGDGYFYGIELVKDKASKESFDQAESERILRGYVSGALYANGLYCRADDRGDPVVQVAPPLICGQAEFDEMEQILRLVLTEAWAKI